MKPQSLWIATSERGGFEPLPGPVEADVAVLGAGIAGLTTALPLTDASIGAYTVGVAMLLAGALGFQEEQMAHGSLLAISFGLLLAAPTAITGLLDWLDLPRDTPAWRTATIHLLVMVTATVLFAITWLLQCPGYNEDEVRIAALVAGLIAERAEALNPLGARGRDLSAETRRN